MASTAPGRPGGPGRAAEDLYGGAETLSPAAVNRILMEFLIYFGRAVFVFYPVYLTGFMGLSVSWVLLCMVMITWWKKNRQWKDARIGSAIDFVDNETHVINAELKSALQMATWVCHVQSRAVTTSASGPVCVCELPCFETPLDYVWS